jgi:ABC-type oligopeptide transport system substrate-binding subunit
MRHGAGRANIIDERTFEIRFQHPEPEFLQNIRMPAFAPLPSEALMAAGSALEAPNRISGSHITWKDTPIGAGPYQIIELNDTDMSIKLEANRFWSKTPEVSTIDLITGSCPEDTDLAIGCSTNPMPTMLTRKQLDIPWAIFGLHFKYGHPMVRDPKFRQAVLYSLDMESLPLPYKKTQTIIPSNWSQWSKLKKRYDPEKAKRLFDDVLSQYSPGKLAMSTTPGIQVRNQSQWIEALVDSLVKAGCPIDIMDADSIRDEVHCFNISGFIPSVASVSTLFALFQEGSGWVPELNERDEIYNSLIDRARTDDSAARLLNEQFISQAYAIPLFEEPASCYINESKIASMNYDYQDISLMPHLVRLYTS